MLAAREGLRIQDELVPCATSVIHDPNRQRPRRQKRSDILWNDFHPFPIELLTEWPKRRTGLRVEKPRDVDLSIAFIQPFCSPWLATNKILEVVKLPKQIFAL